MASGKGSPVEAPLFNVWAVDGPVVGQQHWTETHLSGSSEVSTGTDWLPARASTHVSSSVTRHQRVFVETAEGERDLLIEPDRLAVREGHWLVAIRAARQGKPGVIVAVHSLDLASGYRVQARIDALAGRFSLVGYWGLLALCLLAGFTIMPPSLLLALWLIWHQHYVARPRRLALEAEIEAVLEQAITSAGRRRQQAAMAKRPAAREASAPASVAAVVVPAPNPIAANPTAPNPTVPVPRLAEATLAGSAATLAEVPAELLLAVTAGPDAGRRFLLGPGRSTIGREHDCALLLSDGQASRHHAEFIVAGGTVRLRDLGSRNGLSVNGQRVTEAVLAVGDVIALGATELRVGG